MVSHVRWLSPISHLSNSLANCCWASPAQWFLVPSPARLVTIFYCLNFWESCNSTPADLVGRSVQLLIVFASTVIPGFCLLKIHDQDFYSLLDMKMFRNGVSPSTEKASVFACRRYGCCTVVSAWMYPRCHGVQVTMGSASFVTALYYVTFLQYICRLVQQVMSYVTTL
jgi:hypothetical protein